MCACVIDDPMSTYIVNQFFIHSCTTICLTRHLTTTMSQTSQFNRLGVGKTCAPTFRIDAADSSRFQDIQVINTLQVPFVACSNTITTPCVNASVILSASCNVSNGAFNTAYVATLHTPNVFATLVTADNLCATTFHSPNVYIQNAFVQNMYTEYSETSNAFVSNLHATQFTASNVAAINVYVEGTLNAPNVVSENILVANVSVTENLWCNNVNTQSFVSNTITALSQVSAPVGRFATQYVQNSFVDNLRATHMFTPKMEANIAVLTQGIVTPVSFIDSFMNETMSVTSQGQLKIQGMSLSCQNGTNGLIQIDAPGGRVNFTDPVIIPLIGAGGMSDPQFAVHAEGTIAADMFRVSNPFDGYLVDKIVGDGMTNADRCGLKLVDGSNMHVYAPGSGSVCLGSAQSDGSVDKTLVVTSSKCVGVRNFDPKFSLDVLGTINASEKMQTQCLSVRGNNYTSDTLPSHGLGYTTSLGSLPSTNNGVFPTLCGTSGLNFQVGGANKVTIDSDGRVNAPHVAGYNVTSSVGFSSPGFAVLSSGTIQTNTVSITGGGFITGSPGGTVSCPGPVNVASLSVASGALRVDGVGSLIMTQPFRPVSINTSGSLVARNATFSSVGLTVLAQDGITPCGTTASDVTGALVVSSGTQVKVQTGELAVQAPSGSTTRFKVNADGVAVYNTFSISNFGYMSSPILASRTDRVCIGSTNDYLGMYPNTALTNMGVISPSANSMSFASGTIKRLLIGPNVALPGSYIGIGTSLPMSPLDIRNANTGAMTLSVNSAGVYANVNVYTCNVFANTLKVVQTMTCDAVTANTVTTQMLQGGAISSDVMGSNSATVTASTAGVLAAIKGYTTPSKVTLGGFTLQGDATYLYLSYANVNIMMVNTQGQIFSAFSQTVIKFSVSLSTLIATSSSHSGFIFSWNTSGSLFTDIRYTLNSGGNINAARLSSAGSFGVTGLIANTTYAYTFIPINNIPIESIGGTYSGSVVTLGNLIGMVLTTTIGVASIVVSWSVSSNFASLRYSIDDEETWVTATGVTGLTFTISAGVVIGNTYTVSVQPLNSASVTGDFLFASCTIPYYAVLGSAFTVGIYDTFLILSWSTGAQLESLVYNIGNGDVILPNLTVPGSYTITGLTELTTYNPVVITPRNAQGTPNNGAIWSQNIKTIKKYNFYFRIQYAIFNTSAGETGSWEYPSEYSYSGDIYNSGSTINSIAAARANEIYNDYINSDWDISQVSVTYAYPNPSAYNRYNLT